MAEQVLAKDIAVTYRQLYRAQFWSDLEAGRVKPLLFPHFLLGLWIIPALYLSIPHKTRPWLYRARWLVLAVTTLLNLRLITSVSSHNLASAYGAGLLGAWGIIWNLTILVWTRPQWDAKRVEYSPPERSSSKDKGEGPQERGESSSWRDADGDTTKQTSHHELRERKLQNAVSNGKPHNEGKPPSTSGLERERHMYVHQDPDGYIPEEGQTTGYHWQEFPSSAPFLTRFDWAFDVASTFRFAGWNWALRCLPPYHPPSRPSPDHQLLLSSLPSTSREGYTRCFTLSSFLHQRISNELLPWYLVLDFCAVVMTRDPYFIGGPELAKALSPSSTTATFPPTTVHQLLLFFQPQKIVHSHLSLLGILAALHVYWNIGSLALALLGPPVLGFRAHPFQLPSLSGSFTSSVLDRGLPGFWGSWWHQTFRFGFEAPRRWLLAGGRSNGSGNSAPTRVVIVGLIVAFLQSGALHAAGSHTSMPSHTKPWEPPLFFVLAGLGALVQRGLAAELRRQRIVTETTPRWLRRCGNLAFVLVWLHCTCWPLVDDMARTGLWLWEPVPVSLFRALGFGPPGDLKVWRYELGFFPYWYRGERWWNSGLAI